MDKYILQNQKIPESQKTIEWDKSHVQTFVDLVSSAETTERKMEQLKSWHYYYGISEKERQKRNDIIVKPYGYHMGLEYMFYPLVSNIIEQVLGEWMSRPVKKKTYVINKDAKTKKLQDMFALVSEDILRDVNKELESSLGFVPETENPEMEIPEDVDAFISNGDYKTTSEMVSDLILEQVLEVKNNKEKLKDLLLDLLVQDEVIANVEERDGHPSIERKNIFECEMDWNPNLEIQKDPQYFIEHKYMSFNEIINEFDLTDEEESTIKSYTGFSSGTSAMEDGYDKINRHSSWFKYTDNIMYVRCVEMTWISKRLVKARVTVNKKTQKEVYTLVDEKYIPRKNETVKKTWIDYKRNILMVGPDVVLRHGPLNERCSRIDNMKKDTLLVTGLRRNNFLKGPMQSMAKKLFQLQDFASEMLFEWRLFQRRSNGRVMVYDAAQIPKQFLKSGGQNLHYENALNRVMHHVKKDQILFINSQDRNSRHAFNQFTSLDMSSRGQINDIVSGLALIEQLGAKFAGVSEERGGQVNQYQTATGTERAVQQSTARTEIYISPFETFLEEICMKVLVKGKYTYEENEVVDYILGDLNTKFLKVYPPFFQDDIGVSIASKYKDEKKKNTIDAAASQALSTASDPELILALIDVLDQDTAAESRKVFQKALKTMQQLRDQNNQALQEAEKIKADAEAVKQDKDIAVKDRGYNKDIIVAQIQKDAKIINDAQNRNMNALMKLADLENAAVNNTPNQ